MLSLSSPHPSNQPQRGGLQTPGESSPYRKLSSYKHSSPLKIVNSYNLNGTGPKALGFQDSSCHASVASNHDGSSSIHHSNVLNTPSSHNNKRPNKFSSSHSSVSLADSSEFELQFLERHKRRTHQNMQDTRSEEASHQIQFKSENKNGKKVEWVACYNLKPDEVLYPSLKYLMPNDPKDNASSTSHLKYKEGSLVPIRTNVSPGHAPHPTWKLKISDSESLNENIKAAKVGAAIYEDGEASRRKQIAYRHSIRSGTSVVEHKRFVQRKHIEAPIIGVNSIAKSPHAIRRIELEEDDVYRDIKINTTVRYQSTDHNQEVYSQEKSKLYPMLLTRDAYSMDGLLYYRIQNILKTEYEDKLREEDLELEENPKHLDRQRSAFVRKIQESTVLDSENIGLSTHTNSENHTIIDTSSLKVIRNDDNQSELSVTRVQRAIHAHINGYDYRDINSSAFRDPTSFLDNPSGVASPVFSAHRHDTHNNSFSDSVSRLSDGSEVMIQPNVVSDINQNVINQRNAQDILLLAQLQNGILPEQFMKKNTDNDNVLVDLSHYGIGNTNGRCLAEALRPLEQLTSLCLHNNRLNSKTLSFIMYNLPRSILYHLDLSRNDLHSSGCSSLATYITGPNKLMFLNISICNLDSNDMALLAKGMKSSKYCELKEFIASENNIGTEGIIELCKYLELAGEYNDEENLYEKHCTMQSLDLSWNQIDSIGAKSIGASLEKNKSLKILNIKMNTGIQDVGGQFLASSLAKNSTLQQLIMNQTGIGHKTCFILARIIQSNQMLEFIDVSTNPITEAGARCLFRAILRGLKCRVSLDSCDYTFDERIFNHSFPAENSPYNLDMADFYDRCVLYELIELWEQNPTSIKFTNVYLAHVENNVRSSSNKFSNNRGSDKVTVSNTKSANTSTIKLFIMGDPGRVCEKGLGIPWRIPASGYLTVHIDHHVSIPSVDKVILRSSLDIMARIISKSTNEVDKKAWLRMICCDIYCTTAQVDRLIANLQRMKAMSYDSLTKLDVLKCVWSRLIDSENLFDFMVKTLDVLDRKELIYALTFDNFKFNRLNPSSHWRLNLSDKFQRGTLQQLIAINNYESEYSRTKSKRGDTSQTGNWYNFRNVKFNTTSDYVLDKEFLSNLPHIGVLEFDYVSTSRPQLKNEDKPSGNNANMNLSNTIEGEDDDLVDANYLSFEDGEDSELMNAIGATYAEETIENHEPFHKPDNTISDQQHQQRMESLSQHQYPSNKRNKFARESSLTDILNYSDSKSEAATKIINDAQLNDILVNLGLKSPTVPGKRSMFLDQQHLQNRNALIAILELQHAVAKYYIPCTKAVKILQYFPQDPITQAKVVVCMHNRIWDLYNFDYIMRCFREDNGLIEAQNIIMNKLGCLNIVNPLKPNLKYDLDLRYLDNRILVHSLLEISASDFTEQFIEDPTTELRALELYGSTARLLTNESRREIMRFKFAEVGERSINVSWGTRREQIKRYLVGDANSFDKDMLRIVSMYKQLEKEKALSRGPIEVQYNGFLKTDRLSIGSRGSTLSRTAARGATNLDSRGASDRGSPKAKSNKTKEPTSGI